MRAVDTAARVGGDEFLIALWQVANASDVSTATAKLVEIVSQPCVIEDHSFTVTTSAGIGIYPVDGEDSLMKSDDAAFYEAKRAGKNAFRISQKTPLAA